MKSRSKAPIFVVEYSARMTKARMSLAKRFASMDDVLSVAQDRHSFDGLWPLSHHSDNLKILNI